MGTKCRILYQDTIGKTGIALKSNDTIKRGEIGPMMLEKKHLANLEGTD